MALRRPLVLLKLGGSLITDKARPETPRPEVIRRLAGEIAHARPDLGEALLLGHGSGSFGHASAARYALAGGLQHQEQLPGIGLTQAAAARLHRRVVDALLAAGAAPFSLAPSSFLLSRGGRPVEVGLAPLLQSLDNGLLPVVYGDVVMDAAQGVAIASTEAVLLALAERLVDAGHRLSRALWVGATPGVLDPGGALLPELDAAAWEELRPAIDGAAGTDVTGGIRLRLDTCFALARLGIPSFIFDGRVEGRLEAALRGEAVPGTRVRVDLQM